MEWVPVGEYRPLRRGAGLQVIRDIDPYKSAAADKATGKREVIGGRRQHREFLRRNGYVELGNEMPRTERRVGPAPGDIAREIKRVLGE